MSETKFGAPLQNGKQINLTGGHPAPTPWHVDAWADGKLATTRRFATKQEAEGWQREELLR